METILNAVLPQLLEIAGVVLAGVLTWAAAYAKRKWGLEIESKHRDALHSAILSGIMAALSKGLTGQGAVIAALDYAEKSVPDALKKLNPSSQVLSDLAEAKLQDALGRALKQAVQ